MTVRDRIETILRQVADSENISNYEVIPHVDVLKGDGFLGEFYTGEVRNKDTGKLIQTYIKVPPAYNAEIKSDVYLNEYHYYSKILPELEKFQKEKEPKSLFDNIPRFYCGGIEPGKEYIALENLQVQNYVLHDKTKFIDENHLKTIFKTYGRYHALTFAFKEQHREKFEELAEPIRDIFAKIVQTERLQSLMKRIFEMAYDIIKQSSEKDAAKVKVLIDDIAAASVRGMFYDGEYSSFVHGDCWSNNLLFKYNENANLENLKLIDHQLLRDSTPVHDLSYVFYSGASKKDFDKLDEYLELYHESFSSFARELGSDPDKLLPLEALKSDWKKYGFLGVFMGLMIWQIKLMPKEKIQQIGTDGDDNVQDLFSDHIKTVFQSETFKKNVTDILLHAIEYNII